ncbi:uncharacterized protein BDR25DRAFT_345962 [Lindgomyces ingoldianus]|uniref:Uncharacterized protein n=1 Tax=Lindgomyces ingoldianus TaxID=673940 RepID=A0ACB6QFQ7_9PLEO|nr:uncharacterized protein BDR25DRAFT_345962 [Lindgomyces ingoldianus]KAF2465808.1 hypothetical protein BDR25DRAFT_345962 [Lindgomyces ingoldianus]
MRSNFLTLGYYVSLASAQFQFTVPDPNVTDLSEHWAVGDTMKIAWQEGWHGVRDDPGVTDLWISWFRSDSYSLLLLSNVTFDSSGSLDWKVNVSNDVVKTDPQFVLRFKPHSNPPLFTSTDNESPSRGFILLTGNEQSSSASSSATAPSTSTSTPSSTTASAQSSSSTSEPNAKKKTNVGAIAGGVLGGLVFIGLLCAVALLLLKLAKNKKNARDANRGGQEGYGGAELEEGLPRREMMTGPSVKYSANGAPATEIYGREVPVELEGNHTERK